MDIIKIFLILFFSSLFFISCEKDDFEESLLTGVWKQVSISEDGQEMALEPGQQACKILIDANGVCRYYHQSFVRNGQGPTDSYGTWSMTDGKWINFTTPKWRFVPPLTTDSSKVVLSYKQDINDATVIDTLQSVKKQWSKYHIPSRFTILQITKDELQVRIKTFEGEKRYAMLFAPRPADFIQWGTDGSGTPEYGPKLVTDDNYWIIRQEYRTLKTYVFTFTREDY